VHGTKHFDSSEEDSPTAHHGYDHDPRESDSFGLTPLTPNPISPLVEKRDADLHYAAATAAAAVGAAKYGHGELTKSDKEKKKKDKEHKEKKKPTLDDFELLRVLGQGGFLQVFLGGKRIQEIYTQ